MKKTIFYFMLFLITYFFLVIICLIISLLNFTNKSLIFDKSSSAIEFYNKLKKNNKNKDIVFKIPTNQYLKYEIEYFPLSGIENSLTINCNEMGFWSTYHSDRYGFNNNDDIYNKDINNILLGDSFIQGSCVKENETISYYMNKQGFKTLNLGNSGNGPISNLATYIEYGKSIQNAKNIFYFIFDNDYSEFYYEAKNKILLNYLKKKNFSQNLIYKNEEISKIKKNIFQVELNKARNNNKYSKKLFQSNLFVIELKNSLKLIQMRIIINNIIKTVRINKNEDKLYSDEDIMNLIKVIDILNEKKKEDQNLIIVYLPDFFNVHDSLNNISNNYYHNELLLFNKLKDRNIKFINMKKIFLKKKNKFKKMYAYHGYSHFSQLGYQTTANQIISFLSNN